jgi:hypothetical protein
MRSALILAILVLFSVSCHNDVPGLPSSEEVKGYKYCKYVNINGPQCKSPYEVSEVDCKRVGGKLCDAGCTENCED